MADEIDAEFQDAVHALRNGEKARAKDILTRLLKADQNNATYWLWLSAAVETLKERIYCLETALKLDPENGAAKRGLILLGALPPDENIQPFPLNRPRAWEEKLLLAHEQPKERGLRAVFSSPVTRLAGVLVMGLLIVGAVVFGFLTRRTDALRPVNHPSFTAGPSPTFTLTPTFVNASPQPTASHAGPTPLAALLGVSYTATPLYVNTPRSPLSQDIYNAAKTYYQQGNWDQFISAMEQVATAEPTSADVPYYIAEAYRFKGNCPAALTFYNNALKIDDTFAPAYLGLARMRLCIDPGADPSALYALAIQYDPNYGDTYLDRANYNIDHKNAALAFPDLIKASQLMPDSALVQLAYAQAYLLDGDNAKALNAAEKANSIDLTLLPSYLVLGQAYVVNGQYQDAIKPLETYLIYEPQDGSAYALLGQAYAETGEYQLALDALTKALALDPTQRQVYVYLGNANLQLGKLDAAQAGFQNALKFYPDSFDAEIGLTQTFYQLGQFGNAYLQAETSMSKVTNDTQKALALYWRAKSQVGRGSFGNAISDFQTLLSMPASDMTSQMRQDAQNQLSALLTPSLTPTIEPTNTRTPKPSDTGTPTPTETSTPEPASTP
jgi:tetratricopeptide (TPR) repeat protein